MNPCVQSIEAQNCLVCGKTSGTKIVCDECYPSLSTSQRVRLDGVYQRIVIELFGNECVDCGTIAETESGELCAAHMQSKGSDPLSRYDLAASVCRCMTCHTEEHKANIPKVPKSAKMPKQTQEKQEKHKKLAVCKHAGCPIWATGKGKNAQFCFKHQ